MMRQETSAPHTRIVDALSGTVTGSPVPAILAAADEISGLCVEADRGRELQVRVDELEAETDVVAEAFAAAVGFYDCPCGSEYEFGEDDGLEDYAGLNRWLGAHVPCGVLAQAERDDLADRLQSLDEAHQITLSRLAAAKGSIEDWHGKSVTR